MENYKEHIEKSWSEKKDQFGVRQKGKPNVSVFD